jgi:hypothetical protein
VKKRWDHIMRVAGVRNLFSIIMVSIEEGMGWGKVRV